MEYWQTMLKEASITPPVNTSRIKDKYLKYKEMSSEETCRNFLDVVASRLAYLYDFGSIKNQLFFCIG
jgi:hypothetical protein